MVSKNDIRSNSIQSFKFSVRRTQLDGSAASARQNPQAAGLPESGAPRFFDVDTARPFLRQTHGAPSVSWSLRADLLAGMPVWRQPTLRQQVEQGRARLEESVAFLVSLLGCVEERVAADGGELGEADRKLCSEAMGGFMATLNDVCGNGSPLPEEARNELAAEVAALVKPALVKSNCGGRMIRKPRGYAGDYQTIDEMYADEANGEDVMGMLLDRCLLDATPSQAVRNRRALLTGIIEETMEQRGEQCARVMSIACGPAREISDAFESVNDPERLQVELLDVDEQAIESAGERLKAEGLAERVNLTRGNALRMRSMKHLGEQDLIYSIGLIDYFPDKAVIQLLNQIHALLADGGRVVLGNFHTDNSVKVFMDHVLEWELIHRSEEDMHRLFEASKFGRGCTQIRYEATGINLFAECVKGA